MKWIWKISMEIPTGDDCMATVDTMSFEYDANDSSQPVIKDVVHEHQEFGILYGKSYTSCDTIIRDSINKIIKRTDDFTEKHQRLLIFLLELRTMVSKHNFCTIKTTFYNEG